MDGLKPEGVQVCILQKAFTKTLRGKGIHVVQCYAVTRREWKCSMRVQEPISWDQNMIVKQEDKIQSNISEWDDRAQLVWSDL